MKIVNSLIMKNTYLCIGFHKTVFIYIQDKLRNNIGL